MRYSIRVKLFIVFLILLLIFQLFFLIMNSYFLDDFFLWGNSRMMSKIYRDYVAKADTTYDIEQLIHELNSGFGGNISIVDRNMRMLVSTYSRFNKPRFGGLLPSIRREIINIWERKENSILFYVSSQENQQVNAMIYIAKLPEGRLFIIEKPLGMIRENSDIAQRFIFFSGLGTLIIGSILVFFLSKRLTKPIVEINGIAKEIAELNFNKRAQITSRDEIGALGKSINLISDKLSHTLSDLTAANEKLKKDIEREKSLEKMRRRFVSSVSHELKTPISMIRGYADGLKFNIAKSPEDMRYYCDTIIDESEKMDHLIKDLLDLSSYESGSFTIKKADFDLASHVKGIIEKFQYSIEGEGITIEVEAPEACLVNADKLRMEQVIINFLSNAGRYVSQNGRIKVTLAEEEGGACLTVFNTGDNIPEEELENIWTSFYKIDSLKQKSGTGTGLGLAIVKAIIELHQGMCGVENVPGGVVFWILLPKEF